MKSSIKKNCLLGLVIGTLSISNSTAFATTFLGSTTLSNKSYSEDITVHGSFTGNNIQAKSVTVNGSLKLNNSDLNGSLEVKGSAELANVKISDSISTSGSARFKNVTAKDLDARGSLDLNNSTVANVTFRGDGAVLFDSKTKNITITSSNDQVVIRLVGKTTIDGLLTFANNNGVVIVSNGTTITKGIVGGKLKKEEAAPQIGPIVNGKEIKK
jgi:hypothetical protein